MYEEAKVTLPLSDWRELDRCFRVDKETRKRLLDMVQIKQRGQNGELLETVAVIKDKKRFEREILRYMSIEPELDRLEWPGEDD